MNPTSPHTIFSTFEDNPGYATFKTAIDGLPDVLGYLRQLTTPSPRTSDLTPSKQAELRIRSPACLNSFGIHARFQYRPDTAPGPVVSGVSNRSLSPSCRFQPRRDISVPMTPGPQTYNVLTPTKPPLGTISREPKFKERKSEDFHTIGPGSYEPSLSPSGVHGFRFGKDLLDDPALPEVQPGPGYYPSQDSPSGVGFSIGKAQAMPRLVISQRLGPGCYNQSPRRGEAQAARFGSAARFSAKGVCGRFYTEYVPRYRMMSREEKDAQRKRIEANKDLECFKTDMRKEIIAKKGAQKAVKIEITRMAKSGLLQSIKSKRQQALEDKFRRFEWRMHRSEVVSLQKRWVTLAVFSSTLTIFSIKFARRKSLHVRSRQSLLFLTMACLSIGVILRKAKKIRVRKAMVVSDRQILTKMVPFAKRWLAARKSIFSRLIVHLTEKAITQDIIFQLMVRWLDKLKKVQRSVRTFLARQRLRYVQAKMGWALTEISMHKSAAKRTTFPTEIHEGKATIPDKIKEYYIRICIQKKLVRYFQEFQQHRKLCEQLEKQHKAQLCDLQAEKILRGDALTEEEGLVLPHAPPLSLHLSKEDFKGLIIEAEKNRLNWDRIAQQTETSSSRKGVTRQNTQLRTS